MSKSTSQHLENPHFHGVAMRAPPATDFAITKRPTAITTGFNAPASASSTPKYQLPSPPPRKICMVSDDDSDDDDDYSSYFANNQIVRRDANPEVDSSEYCTLMNAYLSLYPDNPDCSEETMELLRNFVRSISVSKEFRQSTKDMVRVCELEDMFSSNRNLSYEEEEMKYCILMTIASVFTRFISRKPDALLECFAALKNRPSGQPLTKKSVLKLLALHPQVLPMSMSFMPIDMKTAQIPKSKKHPLETMDFSEQPNYIPRQLRSKRQLEIRMTIISISALMREVIFAFGHCQSLLVDGVVTASQLSDWNKIADITLDYVYRKKVTERVGFSVPVFFKEIKSHTEELRLMLLQLAAILFQPHQLKIYLSACVRNMRKMILHVIKGGSLVPNDNTAHNVVIGMNDVFSDIEGNGNPMQGIDMVEVVPYEVCTLVTSAIEKARSEEKDSRMCRVMIEKFKALSLKMFGTISKYMEEYWDIDVVWKSNDRNSWEGSKESKKLKTASNPSSSTSPSTKRKQSSSAVAGTGSSNSTPPQARGENYHNHSNEYEGAEDDEDIEDDDDDDEEQFDIDENEYEGRPPAQPPKLHENIRKLTPSLLPQHNLFHSVPQTSKTTSTPPAAPPVSRKRKNSTNTGASSTASVKKRKTSSATVLTPPILKKEQQIQPATKKRGKKTAAVDASIGSSVSFSTSGTKPLPFSDLPSSYHQPHPFDDFTSEFDRISKTVTTDDELEEDDDNNDYDEKRALHDLMMRNHSSSSSSIKATHRN